MRTSSTVPMARLSHGTLLRSLVGIGARRVDTLLSGWQTGRDPAHQGGRRPALEGPLVAPCATHQVVEPERFADTDRDGSARPRQSMRAWPDAVGPGDGHRDDRRTGAEGQGRDTVTGLVERPIGAASAFREHEQDVTLVEDASRQPEGLHVRCRAIDRVDPAIPGDPAHHGPIEELLLAKK